MTATRPDDDLERLLRATFDSRAATVSHGPAWTGAAPAARNRRWIAPLVAAALVVTLVGAYLVGHSHRSTPPASARPDFTSFDVVGYPVTSRLTFAESRSVVVRTPHGPRHGDVEVTLWARNDYRPTQLEHRRPVRIAGYRGVVGLDGYELYRGQDRPMHDVAWQYAPGWWAVVQQLGNLKRVPTVAELLAVARATRPDTHLAQTTPFRLTAVPAGFSFDHTEIQPLDGGALSLWLTASRHRELTVTVLPAGTATGGSTDVVLRHGGTELDIIAVDANGATTPAGRTAERFVARHTVWDTTDLRFVVP